MRKVRIAHVVAIHRRTLECVSNNAATLLWHCEFCEKCRSNYYELVCDDVGTVEPWQELTTKWRKGTFPPADSFLRKRCIDSAKKFRATFRNWTNASTGYGRLIAGDPELTADDLIAVIERLEDNRRQRSSIQRQMNRRESYQSCPRRRTCSGNRSRVGWTAIPMRRHRRASSCVIYLAQTH